MSAAAYAAVILPVHIARQIETDIAAAVEEVVALAPVLERFERGFGRHAVRREKGRKRAGGFPVTGKRPRAH
jgi:hypothetical protein